MSWRGQGTYTQTIPTSNVRLGDYLVPEAASFAFEGENGDPDMLVQFKVRDGRPQCTEVHLHTKPNGRAVRTSDLHALSLDVLTVSVFTALSKRFTYDPDTGMTTAMHHVMDEREFWRAVNDTEEAVKNPKRGVTEAELENVARIYRENVVHKPVEAVRAALGYGSDRTAARRVEQARSAGLLPPTTPGKRRA